MQRVLAAAGWLAWRLRRGIERTPLRRLGGRRLVLGMAAILVVLAVAFPASELLRAQPQEATVGEAVAGGLERVDGWVRLRGRIVPLDESPTGQPGDHALLVDADDRLQAIVLLAAAPATPDASSTVTGRVVPASVSVSEDLPIEATVAGTPPRIAPDALVVLDARPYPEFFVPWALVLAVLGLALLIGLGLAAGYPVFRPSREVDVLVRPLGPGERVPAAVAGRVGPHRFELSEPAEALLLAGPGPRGGILTVQLLASEGPAPPPVRAGNGWTHGRVGYLHTVNETVPALQLRSDLADAIFLFARVGERDRAAALVSLDR